MQFEINELDMVGYWRVKYYGEVTTEIRNAALAEGLKKAEGKETCGILVDFTQASLKMSVIDLYMFAGEKYKSNRFTKARVAFLHNYSDTEAEEFHALVMKNKGMNGEVFTREKEAMEWLLNGRKPLKSSLI